MRHNTMGIKKTEELYWKLREIRRAATMETMNLDPFVQGNPLTQTVREATDRWRNIHLVSPLDAVLKEIKDTCGFTY